MQENIYNAAQVICSFIKEYIGFSPPSLHTNFRTVPCQKGLILQSVFLALYCGQIVKDPQANLSLFSLFCPFFVLFKRNKKNCLKVHRMNGKVFLRELYFAEKQYLSTLSKNDILFVK